MGHGELGKHVIFCRVFEWGNSYYSRTWVTSWVSRWGQSFLEVGNFVKLFDGISIFFEAITIATALGFHYSTKLSHDRVSAMFDDRLPLKPTRHSPPLSLDRIRNRHHRLDLVITQIRDGLETGHCPWKQHVDRSNSVMWGREVDE